MTDKPNPADFSVNERPREYEVRFKVEGEVRLTIEADSLEDAKAQARTMMEDDDSFGSEIDDVHEVTVDHVWKSPPMYRVQRGDRTMQVSKLEPGDMPRPIGKYDF